MARDQEHAPGTIDWQPGRRTLAIWNGLSLLLLLVGLMGFGLVWAVGNGGGGFSLEGWALILGFLFTLLLTFVLMVVHELIHGLVITLFGTTPSYGAMMMGKLVPVFFCTAPGVTFTRRQFAVIALAPSVVITLLGVMLMAFVPRGGWLVVPAAVHLAGCIGDFGMTAIVARQPAGTIVEDLKTGMRFHRPPAGRPG